MPAQVSYHSWWVPIPRKDGTPGKRLQTIPTPICPVACCERCGRFGSTVWVRGWWQRSCRAKEHARDHSPEPTLCMGCMNVMRPIWAREAIVAENKVMLGRIQREVQRANKNRR